jgi:hypothetical protein
MTDVAFVYLQRCPIPAPTGSDKFWFILHGALPIRIDPRHADSAYWLKICKC